MFVLMMIITEVQVPTSLLQDQPFSGSLLQRKSASQEKYGSMGDSTFSKSLGVL